MAATFSINADGTVVTVTNPVAFHIYYFSVQAIGDSTILGSGNANQVGTATITYGSPLAAGDYVCVVWSATIGENPLPAIFFTIAGPAPNTYVAQSDGNWNDHTIWHYNGSATTYYPGYNSAVVWADLNAHAVTMNVDVPSTVTMTNMGSGGAHLYLSKAHQCYAIFDGGANDVIYIVGVDETYSTCVFPLPRYTDPRLTAYGPTGAEFAGAMVMLSEADALSGAEYGSYIPATEAWLFYGFTYAGGNSAITDSWNLYLGYSTDGTAITNLAPDTKYVWTGKTGAGVRDPDILLHTDGYFYVAYGQYGRPTAIQIARSADLYNWTHYATLTLTDSSEVPYSMCWFVDTDGPHVIWGQKVTGGSVLLFESHPTTANLSGAWSAAAHLTSGGNNIVGGDPAVAKIGTTYYLIYSDTSGAGKGPWLRTSTALTSGYSAGAFLFGSDLASEQSGVVKLANGNYRVFNSNPTNGVFYHDSLAASIVAGAGNWGASTPLTFNGFTYSTPDYGREIRVTDATAMAAILGTPLIGKAAGGALMSNMLVRPRQPDDCLTRT